MPSPCYNRCRGKVRHPSEGKAKAAAKSLVELHAREGKELPDVVAYPCPTCLGWHVGNAHPRAHKSKYAK